MWKVCFLSFAVWLCCFIFWLCCFLGFPNRPCIRPRAQTQTKQHINMLAPLFAIDSTCIHSLGDRVRPLLFRNIDGLWWFPGDVVKIEVCGKNLDGIPFGILCGDEPRLPSKTLSIVKDYESQNAASVTTFSFGSALLLPSTRKPAWFVESKMRCKLLGINALSKAGHRKWKQHNDALTRFQKNLNVRYRQHMEKRHDDTQYKKATRWYSVHRFEMITCVLHRPAKFSKPLFISVMQLASQNEWKRHTNLECTSPQISHGMSSAPVAQALWTNHRIQLWSARDLAQ